MDVQQKLCLAFATARCNHPTSFFRRSLWLTFFQAMKPLLLHLSYSGSAATAQHSSLRTRSAWLRQLCLSPVSCLHQAELRDGPRRFITTAAALHGTPPSQQQEKGGGSPNGEAKGYEEVECDLKIPGQHTHA